MINKSSLYLNCNFFAYRIAEEYAARNAEAMQFGPEYLTNPINAFKLVKRLTHDWYLVENAMTKNSADFFLKNITATRASKKVSTLNDC